MKKYGCLNKNTNKTDYTYVYSRMKSLPTPYGSEPYVQYEVVEGTKEVQYIWDEIQNKVVLNPSYVEPTPDYLSIAKNAVRNAVSFGQDLMIDFAAENVATGITQSGKTKVVADYLADITRYIQTGSLYEVIGEIDRLILEGIPLEVSPYITEERMLGIKQRILDYLT